MTKNEQIKFPLVISRLKPGDEAAFAELNALFAQAFDDAVHYLQNKPSQVYLQALLEKNHVVALVARVGETLAGGLVAYVLDKFEQERSEVYIYDLAVREDYRRQGVATSLINELKNHARAAGAWVIYVQADKGEDDMPAQKLYESLGKREDVFHYDIGVDG